GAGIAVVARRALRHGSARAHAARTDVILGARVAVAARRPVGYGGRIGARAGRGIARACHVALIAPGADHRGPGTHPIRTHVILRAPVAVAAGRAVGLGLAGPLAPRRIAARRVALIARRADHGSSRTHAARTHAPLRARVAVVAGRAVRLGL